MTVTTPHNPIALISCYELGQVPLGLRSPVQILAQSGIVPTTFDLAVEKLDPEVIKHARFVGISVPMHTALQMGIRVGKWIRSINPDAHICYYGLYAGLNRDTLLAEHADSCLNAEFEADLLRLVVNVLDDNGVNIDITTTTRDLIRGENIRVDTRVQTSGYAKLIHGDRIVNVGHVATTRGCRHVCTHCPLPAEYNGRFYAVPLDSVINEIATMVESGAEHITFADPDFLNGPGHARRVANALHQLYPKVTFDYTAKIEHLHRHRALVAELKSLGNIFVVSALESFNDDVLHHLRKGHTAEEARNVIRYFRELDLTLRPSLLPFTPWETMDSFAHLLDVVVDENLVHNIDPVQYSLRLLIPPGSLLIETPAMHAYLRGNDPSSFTRVWSHPDDAMDDLQLQLSALVTAADNANEDGIDTFQRIVDMSNAFRGIVTARPLGLTRADIIPPRLSETWFC